MKTRWHVLLPYQSMALYSTQFYATAPLHCNASCYSTNLWLYGLFHAIAPLNLYPPFIWYDQPAQNYNFTLIPFNIDCNKGLKCLYPTNLWPPTVLLFMLLHHCIALPFVAPPIYDPLQYSFLCYSTNGLQCFCYPANLWPPTVLLIMHLHHCISITFVAPPIYDPLRYAF